MTDFWWNLIEMNLNLVLLWLAYRLARPFLSFGKQRLILLLLPALAVIPLLLKQNISGAYQLKLVELDTVVVGQKLPAAQTVDFSWTPENIYWLTVTFAFCWFAFRLLRLLRTYLRAKRTAENGLIITEIPGLESFSFFRWVQLKAGMDAESRAIVLEHEALPSRKRHTFDLLYLQTIQ